MVPLSTTLYYNKTLLHLLFMLSIFCYFTTFSKFPIWAICRLRLLFSTFEFAIFSFILSIIASFRLCYLCLSIAILPFFFNVYLSIFVNLPLRFSPIKLKLKYFLYQNHHLLAGFLDTNSWISSSYSWDFFKSLRSSSRCSNLSQATWNAI